MAFVAPALPAIAAATGILGAGAGVVGAIRAGKQPKLPTPPPPPTQDTASNAAQQQALMMRRRQGVLANIFAPPSGSGTGSGTQLGS